MLEQLNLLTEQETITEIVRVKQVVMERPVAYAEGITSTERAGRLGMNEIGDEAQFDLSYGNYVKIDHGEGVQTLYAHMSRLDVSIGDRVETGDILGQMGTTGKSTGVHLHFEIWLNGGRVDPTPYLNQEGGVESL